jgi:hypothetical protein
MDLFTQWLEFISGKQLKKGLNKKEKQKLTPWK